MTRLALAALALGCLTAQATQAATAQAFQPSGQTVLVSATTTAASVALSGGGTALLIYNACTVPARVETSGAVATTPTAGVPGSLGIPAASVALIQTGGLLSTVSVKVDSGSACNVELTRGEGMAH